MELLLIEESYNYAFELDKRLKKKNYSNYHHKKMVNIHIKYDEIYYQDQVSFFYSGNKLNTKFAIDDSILNKKFNIKTRIKILAKFFAHYFFRTIGSLQEKKLDVEKINIVRKCYVEDVDMIFKENPLRLIFPFPLSISRQYRYIKSLKKNEYCLTGLPYELTYLIKFLLKPTVWQLQKLESRARIRYVLNNPFHNLKKVECAEEYELGSFEYSKISSRNGMYISNRAHGVGKYLPYHAYNEFGVLSKAQLEYYEYFNKSKHYIFNIQKKEKSEIRVDSSVICLLGQSSSTSGTIWKAELTIIKIIQEISNKYSNVKIFYKKHPNSKSNHMVGTSNIIELDESRLIGDESCLLNMSLFSTCQIDSNFEGKKILIETDVIKPHFVYGTNESIVNIDDLKNFIINWLGNR